MSMFSSKWIIVVLLLILTLVVLFIIGRKSVHAEITIQASPEEIWAVLTDIQQIKAWNPVLIPIEGTLKEGADIKYEFHQDENNSSIIPATVKQMTENQLLNQVGGMTGILTFDHKYILEPLKIGTKVIIHEEYRGIMVPFWDPSLVEAAYARIGDALKDRIIQLKSKAVDKEDSPL